jgi:hypothetical protein
MITIATILPNNFTFDRLKYYNNLPQLSNDISEFIKITEIDQNDLMETIITEIQLTPELIGASPICKETDTNIYQICYAGEKEQTLNEKKGITNPNNISGYLINDTVENNCVLINSQIGSEKTCVPASVYLDTVSQLLYFKFFHIGIVLKADDMSLPTEFIYGDHPLEYHKLDTYDETRYKVIEFEFISLGLCAIIDLEDNTKINKRMTRIIGTEVIYGNVLLISKLPESYLDLTFDLYNQIDKLSFGPLSHRSLTEEEKKDPEKVNDLHVVNNKYCILNARMDTNYENTCAYTGCKKGNFMLNPLHLCKSCFRVKYHDKECQSADWDDHKKECFYKK